MERSCLHVFCGGGPVSVEAARLDGCVVGGALFAAVRGNHDGLARTDLLQQLPLLRRQIVLIHVIALAAHSNISVQWSRTLTNSSQDNTDGSHYIQEISLLR